MAERKFTISTTSETIMGKNREDQDVPVTRSRVITLHEQPRFAPIAGPFQICLQEADCYNGEPQKVHLFWLTYDDLTHLHTAIGEVLMRHN